MGQTLPLTDELVFTIQDRHSPLWLRLQEHFESRLQQLRCKNDLVMFEAERNKLLGQITEIKAFLRLGDEPPEL